MEKIDTESQSSMEERLKNDHVESWYKFMNILFAFKMQEQRNFNLFLQSYKNLQQMIFNTDLKKETVIYPKFKIYLRNLNYFYNHSKSVNILENYQYMEKLKLVLKQLQKKEKEEPFPIYNPLITHSRPIYYFNEQQSHYCPEEIQVILTVLNLMTDFQLNDFERTESKINALNDQIKALEQVNKINLKETLIRNYYQVKKPIFVNDSDPGYSE